MKKTIEPSRGETESSAKGINAFVEEAERFHDAAVKEFKREVDEKDTVLLRDACEKAWNAVIQATNALFLKKNVPLAKSHWERRRRFEELEETEPIIEKLGLQIASRREIITFTSRLLRGHPIHLHN